jgi:fatty-acid desaturase
VKLLLIGGFVGLVIGVVLAVFYFSLATFFAVNAKALDTIQKAAEKIERRNCVWVALPPDTPGSPVLVAVDSQSGGSSHSGQ